MTVLIFSSLIGIRFILLKTYDYYLIKKEIYSRKNIGSFETNELWYKYVKYICCKWVVCMPKIQVSDNLNFVLLEKIKGKYSKNELQAWHRAGLILGLSHCIEKNIDDIEVNKAISAAIQDIFDNSYKWRIKPDQIDYALLAYSIMKLPQFNNNYYESMCEIVNLINNCIGEDGTVYYRKGISKYRLVDTIGMICPFLVRFGKMYDKPELTELAILQLERYMQFGIHPYTSIPSHAYHIESKMPLGIYGWGRGAGWYAIGLIDSYEELSHTHPKKEFLRNKIKELGIALVTYQRLDGGWGDSIFINDNIYDSSITAMAVYFLKKAQYLNIISDSIYVEAIQNGTKKLKMSTRIDGTVDFSQGDTKGIGNYSTVFREFPFTQGIVLSLL